MEIWAVLFPILLTDVMNPVLFAFLVYAAGTERPVSLSTSMLLGHTAAYFTAGLVLARFLESITAFFAEPRLLDFVLEALIGVVLMRFAAHKFVQLLERYPHLETTAFIVVGWVGVKLLVMTLSHEKIHVLPHEFPHSLEWSIAFWGVLVAIIVTGAAIGLKKNRS